MTTQSIRNDIQEQTLRYELYLDLKRGCKITLCVLVIISLIGAVYVGTTPWGQEMIQKLKELMEKPLCVQDILLYLVLVPIGICSMGLALPAFLRRIDICRAQPVILNESEDSLANLSEGELSASEFDSNEWSHTESEERESEKSDNDLD